MSYPIKDCSCEDFPCCEHADNFPDQEPEYCDMCGYTFRGPVCPCDDYSYGENDPQEDPEDEIELAEQTNPQDELNDQSGR